MMCRQVVAAALVSMVLAGAGLMAQSSQPAPQPATTTTPAPVNLNTATSTDLERLPGVGPALATRILEYRQKNGGFTKIEDLMNVTGIGERSFLRLKPLVTVAPNQTAER
jgi:competence protein ComEA